MKLKNFNCMVILGILLFAFNICLEASVQYNFQNANSTDKRIKIRKKPDGNIVVTTYGLGDSSDHLSDRIKIGQKQPFRIELVNLNTSDFETGITNWNLNQLFEFTNLGNQSWKLKNSTDRVKFKVLEITLAWTTGTLYAQQTEIRLIPKPNGSRLEIRCIGLGPQPYSKISSVEKGMPVIINLQGGLKFSDFDGWNSSPKTYNQVKSYNVYFRDKKISIEVIPKVITGIDLYGMLYKQYDKEPSYWMDKLVASEFNYCRMVIPTSCWGSGFTVIPQGKSLFKKMADGKFDLDATKAGFQFNEAVLKKLITELKKAKNNKIYVQIDLLDNVMFNHSENGKLWFERSEFCGQNNNLNFPNASHQQEFGSYKNAFYKSLRGETALYYRDALFAAFDKLLARFKTEGLHTEYLIIGDGNEIDDWVVSKLIMQNLSWNYKSLGNDLLYNTNKGAVPNDNMFQVNGLKYLCLHGIGYSITLDKNILDRVDDIASAHGLKIFFSTDGTGTGPVRGTSGRPTLLNLAKLWCQLRDPREPFRDFLGGFADIKCLNEGDTVEIINWYKSQTFYSQCNQ
jgi:hypothetical protein